SSGSAALELSLRALDVGHGDEVVVPTYACDALHHAVTRCGATPVLADADPETLGPAAKDVARRLTRRTRAVVVVHPFGLGLDLDEFLALGVPVVEDCAQAIGARVAGRSVGSRGALAVCSFYATKLLTTGEGGAVAGAPERVARVRDARDYDEREALVPRFNFKLTDIQAALGRSQLGRLDACIARRRAIAARSRSPTPRAKRSARRSPRRSTHDRPLGVAVAPVRGRAAPHAVVALVLRRTAALALPGRSRLRAGVIRHAAGPRGCAPVGRPRPAGRAQGPR